MASRGRAAADARIAHWPRRFLVRARLVHDVLRVVLARVGLRAAALRCEQHSKEWKEGLPHQCEELPPSSLKHSRGRHSCRSAFSKQIGSNVARNRSVFVRSRFSRVRVFAARTRNSARRRSEAFSAVSQSSKGRVAGHSFEQGLSEALAPIGCNNN